MFTRPEKNPRFLNRDFHPVFLASVWCAFLYNNNDGSQKGDVLLHSFSTYSNAPLSMKTFLKIIPLMKYMCLCNIISKGNIKFCMVAVYQDWLLFWQKESNFARLKQWFSMFDSKRSTKRYSKRVIFLHHCIFITASSWACLVSQYLCLH